MPPAWYLPTRYADAGKNKRKTIDLLKIQNLSVKFPSAIGNATAVHNISFTIKKGEVIGIAGESGSGKSITALSLMKLLPAAADLQAEQMTLFPDTENRINLNEVPPGEMTGVRGKIMGMIFQEPMTSLNPVMTCGAQIAEVLQRHSDLKKEEIKAEVLRLLERVKLPDPQRIFSAYPHQLSGGQKQRVMIAGAICAKPDLLIADEPTTALDTSVQDSVLDLLSEIQAETGTAVLFISHDLQLLERIADRVFVMFRGEIVERGTTAELFKNPQHPYTKALLAARPPADLKLRRLPMISDFMTVTEGATKQDYQIEERATEIQTFVKNLVIDPQEIQAKRAHFTEQQDLLQVKNLTVRFPKESSFFGGTKAWLTAVDAVDLSVKKGETLGLIGESGSGKTTLGRAIMQLQAYTGEVFFDGTAAHNLTPKELKKLRKRMQIIFQDPYASLNPRRPIGKAITEGMQLYNLHKNKKEREAAARELLRLVGLSPDVFNRLPREFSGGQRQRICIARALAVRPDFLLCDESVSALDVSVQAQILNLMADLREQLGLTLIFISHDAAVINFIADRVVRMEKGRIVELLNR